MRSTTSRLGWSTALLTFFVAPFSYGESPQVTVTDRPFEGDLSASPTTVLELTGIERLSATSISGVLRNLPQVFSGSPSEAAAGGAAGPNATFSQADSVDLHGLGNNATLVLVNGQRMASADFGGYVDVSLIPLSAAKRIDVLEDGASASYGADAVAGVVNIVLRDDFDGAESRARFGAAANGVAPEKLVNQLLGKSWDGGNILASAEYSKRAALPSDARTFSRDAVGPLNLLPEQERLSAFLSGKQRFVKAEAFGNVLWSKRTFDTSINNGGLFSTRQRGGAMQWAAVGGAAFETGHDFHVEIDGSLSQATSHNCAVYLPSHERFGDTKNTSHTNAAEVKLRRDIHFSRARTSRYMGGVQVRHETYRSERDTAFAKEARDVVAVHSRFETTLISSEMNLAGADHLKLDTAIRHEGYSDVEGSWTPKVGMIWAPVAPFELRMTYGRSTRNPSFDERDESGNAYVIVPTFDAASGTIRNVLALTGQNSELQTEKATTWTTGFNLHLGEQRPFNLQVTYFDIAFRNRIAYPITGDMLPAGSNQSPYTNYIDWEPSVEEISYWTQSPSYFPQPGQDPAQIDVIVDNRLQNIAIMHVSGIDANVTYARDFAVVKVNWLLRGAYLVHHDRQVLSGEPRVSVRSTIYNPVALRLRGGVTAERGKFVGALFTNYIDRYTDNRLPDSPDIGSWTTLDLNLLYSLPIREHTTALDGFTVGLNVSNVLNQRPPYVLGANHVNFDGANASAVLRFIGVEISKRW